MHIKRREFVSSVLASGLAVPVIAHDEGKSTEAKGRDDHHHSPLDGPLATATVSFGAWPSGGDEPLNRFNTPTAPVAPNVHQVLPYVTTIKEGGSVNFVVAGFHVIAVYGPGVRPGDIDETITLPIPGAPAAFPPIVNDPEGRVYLGINPLPLPQDRVEAVQFPKRGLYLVICAFVPHFVDEMWGWVRVIR
jgi:hypothetical protein